MPPRKRPRPAKPPTLLEDEARLDENGEPLPILLRAGGEDRGRATFFGANASCTSTKTIADLKLNALEPENLRDVIEKLPVAHKDKKEALFASHCAQFPRLWQQWRAGYSLLLYGLGSKRELLLRLAREWTSDGASFSVNGLEPSLTAVQVLVWAAALSRGSKPAMYRSYRPDDLLEILGRPGGDRVYIIIHNIDGPALRSPTSQRLISRLAAVPGVHLAASIDHVNAPLLWDLQTRDRFRWTWHHTPTFAPYIEEVAFAAPPALLAGRREDGAQRGALIVLSSLSQNARHVFRLMASEQLSPGGEQGIAFDRLFQICREQFLVSNEGLLSSFLTEFRDHDLVRLRRNAEGQDVLQLVFSPEGLQHLVENLEQM